MTAAPLAPVPEESVSPTPRSKIRARTRLAVDREEGDVGAVGEQLVAFDLRPDRAEVEVVELLAATTIAHCGLPIETCWNSHSRPPALSVPAPVLGPRRGSPWRRSRRCPMSTEQVSSPVIVGRIGPATVLIANSSASVQPWRRR